MVLLKSYPFSLSACPEAWKRLKKAGGLSAACPNKQYLPDMIFLWLSHRWLDTHWRGGNHFWIWPVLIITGLAVRKHED
jgi:hypothetical protein